MEDVRTKQGKNAAALFNGDFFLVETCSGHRMLHDDPAGAQHYLEPGTRDEVLGAAVLDALDRSRFLPIEEARVLSQGAGERYEEWKRAVMARYGYKSKRSLFGDMARCSIQMAGNTIKVAPTDHDKLEGWADKSADGGEDVVIPANSSAAEVGAALRLAFKRCT